jgi:perosamine synthetase
VDRIRIGIIGAGTVSKEHAAAIAALGGSASLVAAADTAADRLDAFCEAHSVPRRYREAGELLADPDVDLVAIATPPVTHEALAVAALQHGKYVLCEKPLAASLASATRIAEAASLHPGRLSVGYQFRYGPQFRRLQWLCANGWIGDVESARIERHSYIPHNEHGDRGWWGSWTVAGGGVLMTQMIHEVDLLQLLLGRPVAVAAAMDTRYSRIESEDYVEATIRFESGAVARCVGSVNSGRLAGGMTIQGRSGSVGLPWNVRIDDPERLTAALRELNLAVPEPGSNGNAPLSPHAHLYREIVRCMHDGRSLPVSVSEAMPSLDICAAAYESAISGVEVAVPLDRTSVVYGGVPKERYDARTPAPRQFSGVRTSDDGRLLRRSSLAPPAGFSQRARRIAVRVVRRALETAQVQPESLKALVRRPHDVHGGPQVRRWPWPRQRHFDRREKRAVARLMNREILTGGAIVYGGEEEDAYCDAFAAYLGGGYADAVNSGTNAVYLALRALELEPGREVVVPPVSDAGGTMPVVMNLCVPIPADSAPGSILTNAEQIERVLTDRTAAILVTHLAGHPVDMDPILALASARGIPVVEDCAQAHGAVYKGRMVGTLGRIAAFSTMFGKHHSTGAQGGVVFTRDLALFGKAKAAADRGKAYDAAGHQANIVASLNFNQDEISMAIGRVQLAKAPSALTARRRFAAAVERGLSRVDAVRLIGDPPGCQSAYLFLMIQIDREKVRVDSEAFATALGKEGIGGSMAGYSVYPTDQIWHRDGTVFGTSGLPWSLAPVGQHRQFELPNAHAANRAIVRIDIHASLGPREARDLVAAVAKLAGYFKVS